jgi:hypothetical protein
VTDAQWQDAQERLWPGTREEYAAYRRAKDAADAADAALDAINEARWARLRALPFTPQQTRCANCTHFAGDGPDEDDDHPYWGSGRCEMPGFVGYGEHVDSFVWCHTGQFKSRPACPECKVALWYDEAGAYCRECGWRGAPRGTGSPDELPF